MKNIAKLLTTSSLLAVFALSCGCTKNEQEETTAPQHGRRYAESRQKVEPIQRGCNRCGYRRTAD